MFILTILTRLRQFTSYIKVKYLKDILPYYNQENQKVLVFDEYKGALNELYNHFQGNSRLYTGDNKDMTKRQEIIDEFQSDSQNIMNLFLTKASGNAGLTLTKSYNIFDITLSYVPSVNEQCYARAHRISQLNTVTVNKLIVESTIDEEINFLLKGKESTIKAVVDNEVVDFSGISKLDIIDDLLLKLKQKYANK